MRHKYIFEIGKTDTVSHPFSVIDRVLITAFNLRPIEYTKKDDGTLKDFADCDHVTFERLLYDDVYDIDKCKNINEMGVIASAPVLDECGNTVKLTHCNNTVWLEQPGLFRAVYHGDGRPEAAVVYYQEKGI